MKQEFWRVFDLFGAAFGAVHLIYSLKLADAVVTDWEVFLSHRNYSNYKRQTPRLFSGLFISLN